MIPSRYAVAAALLASLIPVLRCSQAEDPSLPSTVTSLAVHPVTDKVAYGAKPTTEDDFVLLRNLGYRMIISVDAVPPEKNISEALSIQSIHLPLGYSRIPTNRVLDLAKATQESDNKVYIHCHHGKYRAPVAAVVACVANGTLPRSDIAPILQNTDCREKYGDLFESTKAVRPVSKERLRFHTVQRNQQLAESPTMKWMSELAKPADRFFSASRSPQSLSASDRLSLQQDADLILQSLKELARVKTQQTHQYRKRLSEALSLAEKIDTLLERADPLEHSATKIIEYSAELHQCCIECHRDHR